MTLLEFTRRNPYGNYHIMNCDWETIIYGDWFCFSTEKELKDAEVVEWGINQQKLKEKEVEIFVVIKK